MGLTHLLYNYRDLPCRQMELTEFECIDTPISTCEVKIFSAILVIELHFLVFKLLNRQQTTFTRVGIKPI